MYKKRQNKSKTHKRQRGGAIYSFNLNDKIGGLPARIPLNGTADGDCPATDTADLGFVNYGATKGGARRKQKNSYRSRHLSKSRNSHKGSHASLSRKNRTRKNKSKSKSRINRRK